MTSFLQQETSISLQSQLIDNCATDNPSSHDNHIINRTRHYTNSRTFTSVLLDVIDNRKTGLLWITESLLSLEYELNSTYGGLLVIEIIDRLVSLLHEKPLATSYTMTCTCIRLVEGDITIHTDRYHLRAMRASLREMHTKAYRGFYMFYWLLITYRHDVKQYTTYMHIHAMSSQYAQCTIHTCTHTT